MKALTLVLHARDDVIVPCDQSRIIAAAIPHAEFVALAGGNHLLVEGEPAWVEPIDVGGRVGARGGRLRRTVYLLEHRDRAIGDDAERSSSSRPCMVMAIGS